MNFFFALLALALLVSAHSAGDHDHDDHNHGHKCACEAIEFDFIIDCSDTVAMTDAMSRLQSGGCAANCTAGSCERDWLIVQTHHDHCPEAGIPSVSTTSTSTVLQFQIVISIMAMIIIMNHSKK